MTGAGPPDGAPPAGTDTAELIAEIRLLAGADPGGVQQVITEVLAALDRAAGGALRDELPDALALGSGPGEPSIRSGGPGEPSMRSGGPGEPSMRSGGPGEPPMRSGGLVEPPMPSGNPDAVAHRGHGESDPE
jgi:hypothetical protein